MSQEWTTVTCPCGHEMQAHASAAQVGVRCAACGLRIMPAASSAPAQPGTECPHCGNPWPRSQARCPSCLARSRTRRKAKQDPLGVAASGKGANLSFSKRFRQAKVDSSPSPQAPQRPGSPPGYVEDAPDERPATVRVKYWWQRPTTAGWPIAASLTALAGVLLLRFAFRAADGGWTLWPMTLTALAGVTMLVAYGVYRGQILARGLMLVLPMLVILGGAAVLMHLVPGSLGVGDLIGLGFLVVLTIAALGVLTPLHGRLWNVLTAGPVGLLGLVLLAWTLGQFTLTEPQQAQLSQWVEQEFGSVRSIFQRERPSEPELEPPPARPVPRFTRGPLDPHLRVFALSPNPSRSPLEPSVRISVQHALNRSWPVEVLELVPGVARAQPGPDPNGTSPNNGPSSPWAVRPPPPPPVPAYDDPAALAGGQRNNDDPADVFFQGEGQFPALDDWRATMRSLGFSVRFQDPHGVNGVSGSRTLPEGMARVNIFGNSDRFWVCEALAYDLPAGLTGDKALMAVAYDVVDRRNGQIAGEIWRPGSERVRMVHVNLQRDGRPWTGRVEVRMVGRRAVAVVGLHQQAHAIGMGRANYFISTFTQTTPRE